MREQILYLKVPHRMVRADRVGQDQDGQSRISVHSIEHPRILNGCERQIIAPCRRLRDRPLIPELSGKPLPIQDIALAFPTA
jgi:hypothetical protein